MARSTLRFPMVFGCIRVHRLLGRGRSGVSPATHWDTASGAWGTSLREMASPSSTTVAPGCRSAMVCTVPEKPLPPWAVKGRMVFR